MSAEHLNVDLNETYQQMINGEVDVKEIEALYKMKLMTLTLLKNSKNAEKTSEMEKTINTLMSELIALKILLTK